MGEGLLQPGSGISLQAGRLRVEAGSSPAPSVHAGPPEALINPHPGAQEAEPHLPANPGHLGLWVRAETQRLQDGGRCLAQGQRQMSGPQSWRPRPGWRPPPRLPHTHPACWVTIVTSQGTLPSPSNSQASQREALCGREGGLDSAGLVALTLSSLLLLPVLTAPPPPRVISPRPPHQPLPVALFALRWENGNVAPSLLRL